MKRVTRKIGLAAPVLTASLIVLAPASSIALPNAHAAAAATNKTSPFCSKVASDATNISSRMGNLQAKVSQAWSQQDQKLANDWQQVDQKVASDRQRADSERQVDFTKLEAKATTGTEQDAVKAYETAVNNAVSTRRAAYDAARQAFRNGVKSAIDGRRTSITSQASTFQSAVNSAIAAAEASCASNPSGGTSIHATFVSSLKTARQTFQGDRKGDTTVGQQVKQLAQTRNAAFKAANQTFQSSLKAARQALDQAFGKTSV